MPWLLFVYLKNVPNFVTTKKGGKNQIENTATWFDVLQFPAIPFHNCCIICSRTHIQAYKLCNSTAPRPLSATHYKFRLLFTHIMLLLLLFAVFGIAFSWPKNVLVRAISRTHTHMQTRGAPSLPCNSPRWRQSSALILVWWRDQSKQSIDRSISVRCYWRVPRGMQAYIFTLYTHICKHISPQHKILQLQQKRCVALAVMPFWCKTFHCCCFCNGWSVLQKMFTFMQVCAFV